ncbi:MAG: hypothetical protein EAZ89_18455 [Bacteroidetes bacterium]|jgi:hypothetical protein|nr:MAG: hypothetical protein EAZ89_18455 [Bacteroidota bacterium]
MNWGYKIAALYTAFVLMILVLVFAASRQSYNLVTKDYYAEEIRYGERMEEIRNAQALTNPVKISYEGDLRQVSVSFPEEMRTPKGEIVMYRPSDERADKRFDLAPDAATGIQQVETGSLSRGLWRVQLRWEADGKAYFQEQVLVL